MTKRLLLLNGLAIFAVVCAHSAPWGYTALFWWTNRYRAVSVPNFDQLGSLTYYILVVVSKLAQFAVPAFLFVSGVFIVYAARNNQGILSYKPIKLRVYYLLIPYFIWSFIIFIVDYLLLGDIYTPIEYIKRLAMGRANPALYYILVLIQLYLLSPVILSLVKKNWKYSLSVAFIIQLAFGVSWYIQYLGPVIGIEIPILGDLILLPSFIFIRLLFFFILGIVYGLHSELIKPWLIRKKWILLISTIILGILAIFETEIVFRISGHDSRADPLPVLALLYSTGFVLSFLAFDKVPIPFSNLFYNFGKKSFGIYIVHLLVLAYLPKILYHVTPWLLPIQFLFQPILIASAIFLPILLMEMTARSNGRRVYRYLFG